MKPTLVLMILSVFAAPALASGREGPSHYAWDDYGYCHEYLPDGRELDDGVVDKANCFKASPATIAWIADSDHKSVANCVQLTPNGVPLPLSLDRCRAALPTHFNWDLSPSGASAWCNEFTPGGLVVARSAYAPFPAADKCRNASPTHLAWVPAYAADPISVVTCAEVTRSLAVVESRDLNECRKALHTHFEWQTNVDSKNAWCVEMTKDGGKVGYGADPAQCRATAPTRFDWLATANGKVECAEIYKKGFFVAWRSDRRDKCFTASAAQAALGEALKNDLRSPQMPGGPIAELSSVKAVALGAAQAGRAPGSGTDGAVPVR